MLPLKNNLEVSEIRSAGFGATQDINNNQVSDYNDYMKEFNAKQRHDDNIALARDQQMNQQILADKQLALKEREILSRQVIADKKLEGDRINKNKWDFKQTQKKK